MKLYTSFKSIWRIWNKNPTWITWSICSENFRNKCIKIYELDPVHFLSTPRLAWQACLKKTGVKLELLTTIYMLIMVEKGIRGGTCHPIHRYAKKKKKKYMKNYNKDIESLCT